MQLSCASFGRTRMLSVRPCSEYTGVFPVRVDGAADPARSSTVTARGSHEFPAAWQARPCSAHLRAQQTAQTARTDDRLHGRWRRGQQQRPHSTVSTRGRGGARRRGESNKQSTRSRCPAAQPRQHSRQDRTCTSQHACHRPRLQSGGRCECTRSNSRWRWWRQRGKRRKSRCCGYSAHATAQPPQSLAFDVHECPRAARLDNLEERHDPPALQHVCPEE